MGKKKAKAFNLTGTSLQASTQPNTNDNHDLEKTSLESKAPRETQLMTSTTTTTATATMSMKKEPRLSKRLLRDAKKAQKIQNEREAILAETSSMTDHRKTEMSQINDILTRNNWKIFEIPPDGHCMYAAIAHQLQDTNYRELRRIAAEWLENHHEEYLPFIPEDVSIEDYAASIRDSAEWGGELELVLLANALNINIEVISADSVHRIQPNAFSENSENKEPKAIKIAYFRHFYGLGEHYNSIIFLDE